MSSTTKYRYWKVEKKESPWNLVRSTRGKLNAAVKGGAKYFTTMEFTLNGDGGANQYYGPLYFDFDGETEEGAIKDAQSLIRIFESEYDYPIDTLHIYITGGRGAHIEAPEETFGAEDGDTNLPYIFKRMAEQFPLATLDRSIYSQGKGRMWRIPNQKRPNGRYKVPITANELLHTGINELIELTQQPRPDFEFNDPADYPVCDRLKTEYEKAHREFYEQQKTFQREPVVNGELQKHFPDTLSDCIKSLLNAKGLGTDKSNPKANFNHCATLLATFYKNAGLSESNLLEDTEEFCANNFHNSKHFPSFDSKQKHLRDQYMYVSKNEHYSFSCGPIRSLRKNGVCKFDCQRCPIEMSRNGDNSASPLILINGKDFFNKEIKMKPYLVKEIVGPHKIIGISADTNVGKSMLAYNLAISIAIGAPDFLGFEISKPCRVLPLNFEMSDEQVHSRHQTMSSFLPPSNGGSLENMFINTHDGNRHLFEDNWDRILATVRNNAAFDLIIVDNLYACSGQDDEKNADLKIILRRIIEVADVHNSSLLLITHHKKHPPETPLSVDLVRGGSTFVNALDVMIQMADSLKDPGLKLMKITKNRDKSPNLGKTIGLRLDPATLWFDNMGPVDELSHLRYPKSQEADLILGELGDEFSTKEYIEGAQHQLGKSERTAKYWLSKLEKRGAVIKADHGQYRKVLK